jgi:hypothetical protein
VIVAGTVCVSSALSAYVPGTLLPPVEHVAATSAGEAVGVVAPCDAVFVGDADAVEHPPTTVNAIAARPANRRVIEMPPDR